MTEDDNQRIQLDDAPMRSSSWPWLALIGTAWVAYEVTHQPILAGAIICAKFGLADFHAAWWLWRHDPRLTRGWITALAYVSAGMSRIFLVALVVVVLTVPVYLMMLEARPGPAQQRPIEPAPPPGFMLLLVQVFALVFTVSGLTLVWLIAAKVNGVRVWLDSRVHRGVRANAWPPTTGTYNVARPIAALSSMVVIFFGPFLLMWPVILLGKNPWGADQFAAHCILSAVWWIGMFWFTVWLAAHALANHPSECWPPNELPRPGSTRGSPDRLLDDFR